MSAVDTETEDETKFDEHRVLHRSSRRRPDTMLAG